jgi:NAD(P)-dependent dehydrogenase (short-subunit alcohol dehydrogenase family)
MSNNKVVIITGGNRGIGLGITRSFLEADYNVIIGARNQPEIDNKNLTFHYADVRKEEDHIKLSNIGIEKYGKIDCYINNAGYSEWRPIDKIDNKFLTNILDTNLKGAFWGSKIASKSLNKGGSIINISSIAGKRGSTNNSAYVASKFGMNGLTQSLAKELGKSGIRVNALCPVLISTDGLMDALKSPYSPGSENPEKFIKEFSDKNSALLRMPTEDEVGKMCVFLASENASAITGQCINVDCGVLPQ